MTTSNNDARAIFLEAVEQDSAQNRADFLDRACEGDLELRSRVERLLKSHELLGTFHDATSPASASVKQLVSEMPGDSIGPYKLVQQIGEGGMGVVFVAEQERPVRRKVALKVVKPGMGTREVVARFEAERQALALMDHPCIAKVYDAGTTTNGQPYFVMELVQGVPVTEYCDECNLTTRERLELFVLVCQAVQHAHQKGIIHRDIKPTNILVAIQDGRPVPKIIDFGVAKAIDQPLTERTLMTAFAQMVGTPLYMSPEQAELSPMGVDTRCDIYSLGVLLYELLTGATPFDKDRLHAASYDELRRIIRDEEPPRPSNRISTLAANLSTTVAEHRRTDARKLKQTVRGDLDWIVMKCLEKDRNRRYDSVGSLARDVERYLHDEPVLACPPSAAYRLKKFIRRNKIAAAFILLLVAALAALIVSNVLIKRERDAKATALARANAVSDFLQQMLASSNPDQAKGSKYTVRELLDDFSAGLGDQLAGEPEVEAAIRSVIGKSYWRLGVKDRAQLHSKKALDLRRQLFGPDDERVADSLVDYAWNLSEQGRHEEAEKHVRDALSIYQRHHSVPRLTVRALWSLQQFLIRQSRLTEAEEVAIDALALAGDEQDSNYAELPNILHALSEAKLTEGKPAEAEELARRSVAIHRRLHGDHHPETAWGLSTLGQALNGEQKFADAEPPLREALAIFREYYTPEHHSIQSVTRELKSVLEAKGDRTALETLANEEAEYAMRSGSPDYHIQLAETLTNQSGTVRGPEDARRLSMAAAARTEEAHRHIHEAIDAYDHMATDHPDDLARRLEAIAGFIQVLKVCLAAPGFAGEVDELNGRLTAELPKLVAAFPESSECQWESAMRYVDWAYALYRYAIYRSVKEHAFSKEIEILEKIARSNPKRPLVWLFLADAYDYLGEHYWDSARSEDAAAAFLRAKEIYDEHPAEIAAEQQTQAYGIASHYVRLAYFLAYTHREDEAAEFVRKAADVAKRITDPVHSLTGLWAIAPVQLRMGDHAGYRETCKALVDVPVADADDLTKVRQIFAWVLGPEALDDLSLPVKRAEEFAANNSLGQPHMGPLCLGMALYRNRQYERAAEQLEASIAAYPSEPVPGSDPISFQRLFLAMTKWQLGRKDEARRRLEKILPDIDKDLESTSLGWNQRAELEVLRREAQTLIEPKEADEAVENKQQRQSGANDTSAAEKRQRTTDN